MSSGMMQLVYHSDAAGLSHGCSSHKRVTCDPASMFTTDVPSVSPQDGPSPVSIVIRRRDYSPTTIGPMAEAPPFENRTHIPPLTRDRMPKP